jgi:hypothetical protein
MTNEQIAALIKRVCRGNRERYECAQKRGVVGTKWPGIWACGVEAADFIESDLLAAIDGQPQAASPETGAVSAEDVLGIVNAVCLEEIAYCDTANFLSGETRGACKNTIDVLHGKIVKRCRERVAAAEKQEVVA